MNFKVSAKLNTGKWWTFGSIKKNKFDNLSLSFKNTQQLKDFVNNGGEWLNFSLFEEEEKKEVSPETERRLAALKDEAHNSDIPF